ncbi:MAG: DUF4411 family protein [Candidatus Krumholzibacteriaceae bacterium]|jgi:hypothetical protein
MTKAGILYAVDTCSLTALRRVYPKDVFEGVWDLVSDLADKGVIISIEDVYEELAVQDDEVLDWANLHAKMFHPLDGVLQEMAKEILSSHSSLLDYRKRKSSADPFLIALARSKNCPIVSEETPSGPSGREKIPDVCKAYGIRCIPLLEMLREQGLRLKRL